MYNIYLHFHDVNNLFFMKCAKLYHYDVCLHAIILCINAIEKKITSWWKTVAEPGFPR